jgi:hypothetical protein
VLIALAALLWPASARAQACCAGGAAVTPARLERHEIALAGALLRAGAVEGSYDTGGTYRGNPSGVSEIDLEQDVFAAARVLERGQVALLVPLIETRRVTPRDGAHFGGGLGDLNASVRYDLLYSADSPTLPGVAVLAGVTAPTGRPADSATAPLAVDATGIGAWQVQAGLALERNYGPWLLDASGIVSKRTARFGQTLGTQFTALAAVTYVLQHGAALALSASYAFEGDATASDGADVPSSSKRLTALMLSGLWPVADGWRLVGGVSVDPPVSALGSNQPALATVSVTGVTTWW